MNPITPALEERGYQVAMFHTTGMGGRLFERAIADGLIAASLDIAVGSELVNEIAGGVGSAGKHRLEAAGKMGIPQIVSPGFIDAFHWGGDQPLPARYKERPHHLHNRLLNVIISSTSEKAAAGELMAEKLNQAKGPTAVVIPMKGVRPRRIPGAIEDPFFESILNAEPGFKAFHKALIKTLKPQVKVVVLDAGLNDVPYI
jgi:uncharacterized protein (UPF0261 family)